MNKATLTIAAIFAVALLFAVGVHFRLRYERSHQKTFTLHVWNEYEADITIQATDYNDALQKLQEGKGIISGDTIYNEKTINHKPVKSSSK